MAQIARNCIDGRVALRVVSLSLQSTAALVYRGGLRRNESRNVAGNNLGAGEKRRIIEVGCSFLSAFWHVMFAWRHASGVK